MARVTFVKRAQQRYETKAVLDDQGQPVKIAMTRKDGTPKVTKTGRAVFITKTENDKTRPLPNRTCGKCGVEIKVGDPYKWIKPKSGPYGGHLMVRCGACPTWQVWDYSSSLSAQIARIEYDADEAMGNVTSVDEVQEVLDNAAQEVRDLAEQKRESAQNIVDGFGHDTYQSEELEGQADELDSWADDIEGTDIPEQDDFQGESECDDCAGSGEQECEFCNGDGIDPDAEDDDDNECDHCAGSGEVTCDTCQGTGQVETDDLDDDQMDEWREAAREAVADAMGNCPV